MIRCILAILVLHGAANSGALAEDYILRLDVVGYLNSTCAEPEESVLGTIETSVEPGKKFYAKANYANRVLSIRGVLQPSSTEKGQFELTVECSDCTTANPPDITSASSVLSIAPKGSILLGRCETAHLTEEMLETRSSTSFLLHLSEDKAIRSSSDKEGATSPSLPQLSPKTRKHPR